jgi:hypothetical protein
VKPLYWAAASIGAAAALFGLGFGIAPTIDAPPSALVHVDTASRTYLAPPCRQISSALGVTSLDNARKLGFSPDARCLELGGFVQRERSLSGQLLEKFGLLPPLPSRWNANGSWNW